MMREFIDGYTEDTERPRAYFIDMSKVVSMVPAREDVIGCFNIHLVSGDTFFVRGNFKETVDLWRQIVNVRDGME